MKQTLGQRILTQTEADLRGNFIQNVLGQSSYSGNGDLKHTWPCLGRCNFCKLSGICSVQKAGSIHTCL